MSIKKVILSFSAIAISLITMTETTFSMEVDDSNLPSSTQLKSTHQGLDPSHRPSSLQRKIDDTYNYLISGCSHWNYNGSEVYRIANIDCEKMIKTLIKASPNQKEFYFLDVGAGNCSWGKATVEYLNKQDDLPEDIIIHVLSVTGERYKGYSVEKIGKCKQYNIDAFKIEELHKNFNQLGLDLKNKLDLVVSSYTFIHLHDPVGTFIQAYNLLRPEFGMILSHGFPVFYGPEEHYVLNYQMVRFLLQTKAPCLVTDAGSRDICQFLVKRPDNKPLYLPLEYRGTLSAMVANTARKEVAYFKSLESLNISSINMPNKYRQSSVHGDYDLFEWVWTHYLEWQTETVSYEPLVGTKEEVERARLIKYPLPLFLAADKSDLEKLKELFAAGADVNQKNALGIPLILTNYDEEVQKFLLDQEDFDPNARDNSGRSVAHFLEGEALALLLKKNPNLSVQDKDGNTPLHSAIQKAERNNIRIADVSLLLENGADPSIRNHGRQTPFELEEAQHQPTAQIIETYSSVRGRLKVFR